MSQTTQKIDKTKVEKLDKLSGALLRKMIINSAKLIDINKDHVDALNVFPVPDGDTGTNMSLTMMSCAKEVAACPSNGVEEICGAMSKGALRGARGNSGVILSQIIKGIANGLASAKEINIKAFAKSLANGSDIAYKAVTNPKEGTMLTIIKALADSAKIHAKKSIEFPEFLDKIIIDGEEMLKKTPDMLPVLKKAGVIDAGGRGVLILFRGFYNILLGIEDVNLSFDDTVSAEFSEKFSEGAHFDFSDLADIEFAYCTEFQIVNIKKKTTEANIDRLRDHLETIGDSVLVIGDLQFVKVHVHTNEPGIALTYALELGEVDKIKIDNMLEQNRELVGKKQENLKPFGMVAICAGQGLADIFKDLTVDFVVEGGQTMNPSAEDIAKACDKVKAKDIFVFPNNKNIILAAQQAKALSKRNLHIIESKDVPQGLSAVLAFDGDKSAEENLEAMTDALGSVKAGAVTYAVRETSIDNLDLKKGDIIGLCQSSIVSKGDKVDFVTKELIDKMMNEDVSMVTLYFGNDVKEEEAQLVAEEIAKKYTDCEVDIHFGGQPLYYYIVSLE